MPDINGIKILTGASLVLRNIFFAKPEVTFRDDDGENEPFF